MIVLMGNIDKAIPCRIYERQAGYLGIGNSIWLKEKHFEVK